jgi:hypothetical protein
MRYVIDILIGIVGNLIANELWARAYESAQKLVRKAARFIPVADRERQLKEWLGDLNERPSAFAQLSWALNCYVTATFNRRILAIEMLQAHAQIERMIKSDPQLRPLAARHR